MYQKTTPVRLRWLFFSPMDVFFPDLFGTPFDEQNMHRRSSPQRQAAGIVFTLFFSQKAFVESAVFINFGRHYASVFMSVVSFGFPRGRDGFPVVFEWGIRRRYVGV